MPSQPSKSPSSSDACGHAPNIPKMSLDLRLHSALALRFARSRSLPTRFVDQKIFKLLPLLDRCNKPTWSCAASGMVQTETGTAFRSSPAREQQFRGDPFLLGRILGTYRRPDAGQTQTNGTLRMGCAFSKLHPSEESW